MGMKKTIFCRTVVRKRGVHPRPVRVKSSIPHEIQVKVELTKLPLGIRLSREKKLSFRPFM